MANSQHSSSSPPRRPQAENRDFVTGLLCELHLSGGKLDEAAPHRRRGRMACWRTLSARRLHRHQHGAAARECRRLLQQARHVRTNGYGEARARSDAHGCHAAPSPPTPSAFSFMRSPTSCAPGDARAAPILISFSLRLVSDQSLIGRHLAADRGAAAAAAHVQQRKAFDLSSVP